MKIQPIFTQNNITKPENIKKENRIPFCMFTAALIEVGTEFTVFKNKTLKNPFSKTPETKYFSHMRSSSIIGLSILGLGAIVGLVLNKYQSSHPDNKISKFIDTFEGKNKTPK